MVPNPMVEKSALEGQMHSKPACRGVLSKAQSVCQMPNADDSMIR